MEKLKKIDLKRLEESFKLLDDDDIATLGLSLIKEIKFMKKTMASLKKEINDKGVVVSMPQGNYDIERANPALASYNTMVKNYNSTIKQVCDLLSSRNINPEDNFEDDDLM